MSHEHLFYGDVTEVIIRSFFHVYRTLGYGFLEKVYENALLLALRKEGLSIQQQVSIEVHFDGCLVGLYTPDLLVANSVITEIKAVDAIHSAHEAQLINYLRATNIEVGLLLNFGPTPEFRRRIFTNDRKHLRLPPKRSQ